MLKKDPLERISAKEILQHPWIKKSSPSLHVSLTYAVANFERESETTTQTNSSFFTASPLFKNANNKLNFSNEFPSSESLNENEFEE